MASHSHVQLDASRKTRCYCYLINHTRLIHSDFRVSLVCFAGHKTKKFRSKRPAPRQTTTKRKLLSAHVIFAKLGLIHQPNYLTLANRWGPNNNVNKSCSFFFFLQMPPFWIAPQLACHRVDKYLLGCFALYIVVYATNEHQWTWSFSPDPNADKHQAF